jgi:hypothetical protein
MATICASPFPLLTAPTPGTHIHTHRPAPVLLGSRFLSWSRQLGGCLTSRALGAVGEMEGSTRKTGQNRAGSAKKGSNAASSSTKGKSASASHFARPPSVLPHSALVKIDPMWPCKACRESRAKCE